MATKLKGVCSKYYQYIAENEQRCQSSLEALAEKYERLTQLGMGTCEVDLCNYSVYNDDGYLLKVDTMRFAYTSSYCMPSAERSDVRKVQNTFFKKKVAKTYHSRYRRQQKTKNSIFLKKLRRQKKINYSELDNSDSDCTELDNSDSDCTELDNSESDCTELDNSESDCCKSNNYENEDCRINIGKNSPNVAHSTSKQMLFEGNCIQSKKRKKSDMDDVVCIKTKHDNIFNACTGDSVTNNSKPLREIDDESVYYSFNHDSIGYYFQSPSSKRPRLLDSTAKGNFVINQSDLKNRTVFNSKSDSILMHPTDRTNDHKTSDRIYKRLQLRKSTIADCQDTYLQPEKEKTSNAGELKSSKRNQDITYNPDKELNKNTPLSYNDLISQFLIDSSSKNEDDSPESQLKLENEFCKPPKLLKSIANADLVMYNKQDPTKRLVSGAEIDRPFIFNANDLSIHNKTSEKISFNRLVEIADSHKGISDSHKGISDSHKVHFQFNRINFKVDVPNSYVLNHDSVCKAYEKKLRITDFKSAEVVRDIILHTSDECNTNGTYEYQIKNKRKSPILPQLTESGADSNLVINQTDSFKIVSDDVESDPILMSSPYDIPTSKLHGEPPKTSSSASIIAERLVGYSNSDPVLKNLEDNTMSERKMCCKTPNRTKCRTSIVTADLVEEDCVPSIEKIDHEKRIGCCSEKDAILIHAANDLSRHNKTPKRVSFNNVIDIADCQETHVQFKQIGFKADRLKSSDANHNSVCKAYKEKLRKNNFKSPKVVLSGSPILPQLTESVTDTTLITSQTDSLKKAVNDIESDTILMNCANGKSKSTIHHLTPKSSRSTSIDAKGLVEYTESDLVSKNLDNMLPILPQLTESVTDTNLIASQTDSLTKAVDDSERDTILKNFANAKSKSTIHQVTPKRSRSTSTDAKRLVKYTESDPVSKNLGNMSGGQMSHIAPLRTRSRSSVVATDLVVKDDCIQSKKKTYSATDELENSEKYQDNESNDKNCSKICNSKSKLVKSLPKKHSSINVLKSPMDLVSIDKLFSFHSPKVHSPFSVMNHLCRNKLKKIDDLTSPTIPVKNVRKSLPQQSISSPTEKSLMLKDDSNTFKSATSEKKKNKKVNKAKTEISSLHYKDDCLPTCVLEEISDESTSKNIKKPGCVLEEISNESTSKNIEKPGCVLEKISNESTSKNIEEKSGNIADKELFVNLERISPEVWKHYHVHV